MINITREIALDNFNTDIVLIPVNLQGYKNIPEIEEFLKNNIEIYDCYCSAVYSHSLKIGNCAVITKNNIRYVFIPIADKTNYYSLSNLEKAIDDVLDYIKENIPKASICLPILSMCKFYKINIKDIEKLLEDKFSSIENQVYIAI